MGHLFELEADCTIPAEYVLLRHYLGEPVAVELEAKIGRYLRRISLPSITAGAVSQGRVRHQRHGESLLRAQDDRRRSRRAAHGPGARGCPQGRGAEAVNVFTRIQLALFDAGSWSVVPTMPPELILLPPLVPDPSVQDVVLGAHGGRAPAGALREEAGGAQRPGHQGGRTVHAPADRPETQAADPEGVDQGFNALDKVLKVVEGIGPGRCTSARSIPAQRG
jgi:squalene-hopene/tetraprenyl-beta-curcumene cyclase